MRQAIVCSLAALTVSCASGAGSPDDAPGTAASQAGTGGTTASTGATGGSGQGAGSGTGGAAGANKPGCVGSVPVSYDAPTDRDPHPAMPPALGPAGTVVTDPSYGTKLLRLTDGSTIPGSNLSYRVANEFWGNDWNTDATMFYIQASSGAFLLFDFDPKTLVATRVADNSNPSTPLKMPLAPGGFSRIHPTILYGLKGLTIAKFDFSTQTRTDLVDLTTIVPGATGYALTVEEGANGLLATSFGGPQQDKMPYVATWDPATMAHHVVDVTASTLDGQPIGTMIGGGVHSIKIDHSGRYVTFGISGGSSSNWIWDTQTQTVQAAASAGTLGWGAWVRKGGSQDAYQWQLSTFADPMTSVPLVMPELTPTDKLASSSLSWQNAIGTALSPVLVETMRQPADTGPWRAWDDELFAVATDAAPMNGTDQDSPVWRFAHTFNTYSGTVYSDNFYYLFIPRISQNGWFAIIDSNWNQTLGTDASGNPRTDAFIVALPNPCGP